MSRWSERFLGRRLFAALVGVGLLGWTGGPSAFAAPSDPLSIAPAPTPPSAAAAVDPNDVDDPTKILEMEPEQLAQVDVRVPSMETEVTTVSRTAQPIARTPAAVYVVTNEMIRRSGARNVPEALRTVPGVSVARINASSWAITIRGLNSRFANKLLVQIDGVAIYSPTHSGVFWEREHVMLEDVERIEVIRGPGATVWGANAVNGVINIVTKSAKDTHGAYVGGGGGNEHKQFGDFRVGGQSGDVHWRTYGMTAKEDDGLIQAPYIPVDQSYLNQGGFRMDWAASKRDTITVQGDFYSGDSGQFGAYAPPSPDPGEMDCRKTMFMTRWARQIDEDTDWAVQLYYYNPYGLGSNTNTVSTFDADFQYHMKRGRHDIVCGAGYRNSYEHWVTTGFFSLDVYDSEQIPSYFIQDTITLREDLLFATFGSKFDHNSVTDFEFQPTARLTWTPTERTSVWGAISRAVRTPSLIERIYTVPRSEGMVAYELGMRQQPNDRFFWEAALFFNRYDAMIGYETFWYYDNSGKADTQGAELNATYKVTDAWRLTGSCTFYSEYLYYPANHVALFYAGATPRNQFALQSGWDLSENVTLDVTLRYVDQITPYDFPIPSYFTGDIRLAWRPRKNLELSVVGQNLLGGPRYEFIYERGSFATELEPGVYGMAAWRF